jgi:hypothetical protein
MSHVLDLKCLPNDKQLPVAIMAKLFLQRAIAHKADLITFELDEKAHKEIKAEKDGMKTGIHDMKKIPIGISNYP